jgi:hypothetical protein
MEILKVVIFFFSTFKVDSSKKRMDKRLKFGIKSKQKSENQLKEDGFLFYSLLSRSFLDWEESFTEEKSSETSINSRKIIDLSK